MLGRVIILPIFSASEFHLVDNWELDICLVRAMIGILSDGNRERKLSHCPYVLPVVEIHDTRYTRSCLIERWTTPPSRILKITFFQSFLKTLNMKLRDLLQLLYYLFWVLQERMKRKQREMMSTFGWNLIFFFFSKITHLQIIKTIILPTLIPWRSIAVDCQPSIYPQHSFFCEQNIL